MNQDRKFIRFLDEAFKIGVGFIKAQLIIFAANFVVLSVFFLLFDLRLAVLIALGISILDMLPVVGSGLAFLPWIIRCLIVGNHTLALKLGLLFIGLVVLRQILYPVITGKQIGIKPLIALLAAIIGTIVLGPIGIVVGPVVTAVVKVIITINENKNINGS